MANVPKFGKWEDDDNVSYTEYFQVTRHNQERRIFESIVPHRNQDTLSRDNTKTVDFRISKESVGLPSRVKEKSWKTGGASPQQVINKIKPGCTPRRGSRINNGSEYSPANSPHSPYISSRTANKIGSVSPSYGKSGPSGSSYTSSPKTPGRSQLMVDGKGDEKRKKGLVIPEFGEWNVNEPTAGEQYSLVFNKVRVERQRNSENSSSTSKPDISNDDGGVQKQSSKTKKCLCFFW